MNNSESRFKIIIIDDDDAWGNMLRMMAEALGHTADCVQKMEDALDKIKIADEKKEPYSIATIDRNFRVGEKGIEVARGKEVLMYIKKNYKYIACIMVSGSGSTSPEDILDLRDDYDLDYYLQKDQVDIGSLRKAFERAIRRSRPQIPEQHRTLVKETLDRWKSIRARLRSNFSYAKEKAAQKGIDVDITTRNEIERYTKDLEEAEDQIKLLEDQLNNLNADDQTS